MTFVSLGFLFIFLLLIPNLSFGQDIQLTETIKVDPTANLQVTPWSFCVTEDELFLLPDYQAGTIKIFGKDGDFLKFIKAFGRSGIGKEEFSRPMYCFYSQSQSKLGVIDYGVRKVFFFDRSGKIDFAPIKIVNCPRLGYDMELAGDGKQLVISGYITNKKDRSFDLYSLNIENGQINYLLPSHEKYNLKTNEDFVLEFREKQTLPAIGIKAFMDIQGDDLFFVWEGALRIIKLNLRSRETSVFGQKTSHYIKPDASRLSYSYVRGDFETTWKEQKKTAYVRNIFATPRHVFLVYEMAKSNNSNISMFRLQKYTPEGDFLGDDSFPGNPGLQMWFDEENYELYAFSEQSEGDNRAFAILKYKIKINR
jgi:hypothetical protein